MTNYDLIGRLWDTEGSLLQVRHSVYESEPEGRSWLDAIELKFEHAIASIYAEPDFDTVRLVLVEVDAMLRWSER
jgi:hypothetical protein